MHAIKKLDVNKACGSDDVYSEHKKYAPNIHMPLLSMCFTSCIAHGFSLAMSMLSVVIAGAEFGGSPGLRPPPPPPPNWEHADKCPMKNYR